MQSLRQMLGPACAHVIPAQAHVIPAQAHVIPAQAGIQVCMRFVSATNLGSRLRGNDGTAYFLNRKANLSSGVSILKNGCSRGSAGTRR